jgi:integrase
VCSSDLDSFFVSAEGNSLDNDQISKRFQRFSKRLGFTVTPHSLRRAFVTINAGKGKPIVHLQIACGHADINTTRAYCQTSENEVIEAMKNW